MSYRLPWYHNLVEWCLLLIMMIAFGIVGFLVLFIVPCLFIVESVQIAPCSQIVNVGGCDRVGDCAVMLENGQRHVVSHPVAGERICPSVYGWPIRWLNIRSDERR
jgi:hypothetical protein